jgi:hypothetical protein
MAQPGADLANRAARRCRSVATLIGYVAATISLTRPTQQDRGVVTLAGGTLSFNYDDKGNETLVPLSATKFSWSGSVVSSSPARAPAGDVIHYANSDERGPRRK